MPLNRPAAPTKLPSSDFENPYFRAWGLRGSDGSASSGRASSPQSSPASPLSLPTNLSAPSGRSRGTDRYSRQSEASTSNAPAVRSPLQNSNVVGYASLDSIDDSANPANVTSAHGRSAFHKSSVADDQQSRRSSEKSRGRRWQGSLDIRDHLTLVSRKTFQRDQDPDEQKRPSVASKANSPFGLSSPHAYSTSTPQTPLTGPRRYFPPINPNIQEVPEAPPTPPSQPLHPPSTPKAGLYSRTKRALGIRKDVKPSPEPRAAEPPVVRQSKGDVLDKTSTALRQYADQSSNLARRPDRRLLQSSSSTSGSTLSKAVQTWQHRRRRLLPRRILTSTSSSPSLLLENSPSPPPDSSSVYMASDQRQYPRVELSDPNGPAFLPSEASRISTPPLVEETHERRRAARGFFFDYEAPQEEKEDSPLAGKGNPKMKRRNTGAIPGRRVSETEWYRVKLEDIDADEEEEISQEEFVLRVPDHLPNSPMCPRHPKHKSGGTGVCIYHGRNPSRRPTVEANGNGSSNGVGRTRGLRKV